MGADPQGRLDGEPDWVDCDTVEEAVRRLNGANGDGKVMTALRMDNLSLGDEDMIRVAHGLRRENCQVQYLSWQDNQVGVAGARALGGALEVNRSIRWIYLNGNPLGPEGARALLAPLKKRQNQVVQLLDMESTQLGLGGARALAEVLSESHVHFDENGRPISIRPCGLKELGLGRNQLGRLGGMELADALASNSTLTAVDLGSNALGSTGVCALAEGLAKNTTLRSVELDQNEMGNAGGTALAELLKDVPNTTLVNVVYRNNPRFVDAYIKKILNTKLEENRQRFAGGRNPSGGGGGGGGGVVKAILTGRKTSSGEADSANRRKSGSIDKGTKKSLFRRSGIISAFTRRSSADGSPATSTTTANSRASRPMTTEKPQDEPSAQTKPPVRVSSDAWSLESGINTHDSMPPYSNDDDVGADASSAIEQGRESLRRVIEAGLRSDADDERATTVSADPQEVPAEYINYLLSLEEDSRELGKGGFGTVFAAHDPHLFPSRPAKSKSFPFAIKEMDLEDASAKHAKDAIQTFRREVNTHLCFRHPNIARLYAFHMSDIPNGKHYLLYELAENGSLFGFLRSEEGRERLSWEQRIKIAFDTTSALFHLHTSGESGRECFHRDIKPKNICLTEKYSAKLIDCGLATMSKTSEERGGNGRGGKTEALFSIAPTQRVVGTAYYLDPMSFMRRYRAEFDVYAVGIVLLELLTGILQRSSLTCLTLSQRPSLERFIAEEKDDGDYDDEEDGVDLVEIYGRGTPKRPPGDPVADRDPFAGEWNVDAANELARLARECLDVELRDRPKMRDIAQRLRTLVLNYCKEDVLDDKKGAVNEGSEEDDGNGDEEKADDGALSRGCALCPDKDGVVRCRPLTHHTERHWLCRLCFLRTVEEQIDHDAILCPVTGCASSPFSYQEISNHASADVLVAHLEQRRGRDNLERLDKFTENLSALQASQDRLEVAMREHRADLESVKNALGSLSAGRTAVCPRLVWIIPARTDQNLEEFYLKKWGYGLVKMPIKLYFVCEHSHEVVNPPLEFNVTREFMVRTAFCMKMAMMAAIGYTTVGALSGAGLPLVDGALLLASMKAVDEFANNELDNKVRDYLKDPKRQGKDGGDSDHIELIAGRAYAVLSDKVRKPKRYLLWKDKIEPVLMENGKRLVWVKTEYADVLRAQAKTNGVAN